MMVRAGVALMVTVLALGVGGTVAGAKKKHRKGHVWGSKITLRHPSPTRFSGRVARTWPPAGSTAW